MRSTEPKLEPLSHLRFIDYFAFFCSQDDSFEVTPEAIDSETQLVDSLGLFCFPESEVGHIEKKG